MCLSGSTTLLPSIYSIRCLWYMISCCKQRMLQTRLQNSLCKPLLSDVMVAEEHQNDHSYVKWNCEMNLKTLKIFILTVKGWLGSQICSWMQVWILSYDKNGNTKSMTKKTRTNSCNPISFQTVPYSFTFGHCSVVAICCFQLSHFIYIKQSHQRCEI